MSELVDFTIQGTTLKKFNRKEECIRSSETQHIEIPTGITTIGPHVFEGDGFEVNDLILFDTLVIPEGVKAIQSSAFAWSSIEKLYLPNTLESISSKAFAHTSIHELHIASGAQAAWDKAFFTDEDETFESSIDDVYADHDTVAGTVLEDNAKLTFLQAPFSYSGSSRIAWLQAIRALNGDDELTSAISCARYYNNTNNLLQYIESLRVVLLMGLPTPQGVKHALECEPAQNSEIIALLNAYLYDYEKLVHGVVEGQPIYSLDQLSELISEDDLNSTRKACKDFIAQEAKKLDQLKSETRPEKIWKTKKLKDSDGVEVCKYLAIDTKATIPAKIKGKTVISVNFYSRSDDSAKAGLGSLTELILEEGIERIGDWAFDSCDKLENLTIPRSVFDISSTAFNDCKNLNIKAYKGSVAEVAAKIQKVRCEIIEEPIISTLDSKALNDFEIAGSTLLSYKCKDNWDPLPEYRNPKIPQGITRISSYAFENPKFEFDNVVIPEGVVTIESEAFSGCRSKGIYIPSTIIKIYSKAFSFVQCENLYIATGATANWNSVFSISDKEYNWMECLNICQHIYSGPNEVRDSALEFVAEMTFLSNPFAFSSEQRKEWSEWIAARGKGEILGDVLDYAEFFVDSRKGEDPSCTIPLCAVLVLNLSTTSAIKSRLGKTNAGYKEIIRILSSYLENPSKIIAEAGYTQEQIKELCSLVGTKPPKIK